MPRSAFALALAILTVVGIVTGCEPEQGTTLSPNDYRAAAKRAAEHPSAPAPPPKTTAEVEKLGIPVYPGAVLDDAADSSTVEERPSRRTYKVKMYAPDDNPAVLAFYSDRVAEPVKAVTADAQRITGKSTLGDEIDVRLSPVTGAKRTLVMVWVVQAK